MLPIIDLISHRSFTIRNFEEDKNAILRTNKGLIYLGKDKEHYKFKGHYYLTNPNGNLIESFEIGILIDDKYPNSFPVVISLDNKIKKIEDNHINDNGIICFDHYYTTNSIAKKGLRIFDFISFYLPKYFSWILVKQYTGSESLKEWSHGNDGTKQLFESLLGITDKNIIYRFLNNYINASKVKRNDKCYCGNGSKIKHCHLDAINFLKATPINTIKEDMKLFT